MNQQLLEKAKEAKSAEELLALAKENGMELTEEDAAEYFAQLHKSGELSDEELDNVAGGGCQAAGLVKKGDSDLVAVGDLFKVHDLLTDKYLTCSQCGNKIFRSTGREEGRYQSFTNAVCTECGTPKRFMEDSRADHYNFHKYII